MAFYESLRHALRSYAGGLHVVGTAASSDAMEQAALRMGRKLPAGYADFLLSFDGASLFHEQVMLFAASDPALSVVAGEQVRIGETPEGALWMDAAGAISLADEELVDPIGCGSELERYLSALFAREALIFDRDGEFRDVWDADGVLKESVRRKRILAGRKHDPLAALYLFEEGELLMEQQDSAGAMLALSQAVALDPKAGPALELLGSLLRARGENEAAEQTSLRAAEATGNAWLKASRILDAALAAPQRQQDLARAALAVDPAHGEKLLAEARQRLSEAGPEAARELSHRLQLLLAGSPAEQRLADECALLFRDLRTRESLRVL